MKPLVKNSYFLCLFLVSIHAHAEVVFDGYASFYNSLPNRLFSGKTQGISAKTSIVHVDNKKINLLQGEAFSDEPIFVDDIGTMPTLYREKTFFCLEGAGGTSGTATRHIAVYLINRKNNNIYKLPSLFASCAGVGKNKHGQPTILAAELINYRSAYDADGVIFTEYRIRDHVFEKTGKQISAKFVEPGNFYKFVIQP